MNTIPLTLEGLAARITGLEQTAQKNSEDHGKIYARMEAVEKGQAIINVNLSNIEKMCKEISLDVKALKERPIKRYDTVVNAILQWVVVGILGAVIIFK